MLEIKKPERNTYKPVIRHASIAELLAYEEEVTLVDRSIEVLWIDCGECGDCE